jgi:hypothetical protein
VLDVSTEGTVSLEVLGPPFLQLAVIAKREANSKHHEAELICFNKSLVGESHNWFMSLYFKVWPYLFRAFSKAFSS